MSQKIVIISNLSKTNLLGTHVISCGNTSFSDAQYYNHSEIPIQYLGTYFIKLVPLQVLPAVPSRHYLSWFFEKSFIGYPTQNCPEIILFTSSYIFGQVSTSLIETEAIEDQSSVSSQNTQNVPTRTYLPSIQLLFYSKMQYLIHVILKRHL